MTDVTEPHISTSNPAVDSLPSRQLAPWKMWTTVAVLVGFVAPFFYFGAVIAKDPTAYALTVAIILTGGALGWVIGIFISPLPDEKDQFQSYAQAVAAGISGYALAKIDPIVTTLLQTETALAVEGAFRFLSFVVAFIVSMLAAFGWRRYT